MAKLFVRLQTFAIGFGATGAFLASGTYLFVGAVCFITWTTVPPPSWTAVRILVLISAFIGFLSACSDDAVR